MLISISPSPRVTIQPTKMKRWRRRKKRRRRRRRRRRERKGKLERELLAPARDGVLQGGPGSHTPQRHCHCFTSYCAGFSCRKVVRRFDTKLFLYIVPASLCGNTFFETQICLRRSSRVKLVSLSKPAEDGDGMPLSKDCCFLHGSTSGNNNSC